MPYFWGPKYEMVDLGLRVKWANMNIGATKPEEDGLYFAWGEIQGYTGITSDKQFNWSDYKWMKEGMSNWDGVNKYTVEDGQTSASWYDESGNFIGDGKNKLDSSDDAAHKLMGGSWRIPTKADFEELISGTTQTVDTVNGVSGMTFTSKVEGNTNSIFVPFAGSCDYGDLYDHADYCYLWSSSVYEDYSYRAWYLYCDSNGNVNMSSYGRYSGYSVRGVCEN